MHARRHVEAYTTMPPVLYERIMRAHLPTTMFHEMSEETFQAYFRPWVPGAGQAAYYRFLAQLDEGYLDRIERRLGELPCPARIIWGERDDWIPVATAERLRALIGEAEIVTVEGAGHFLLDDAPEAVHDAVSEFLAAYRPGTPR